MALFIYGVAANTGKGFFTAEEVILVTMDLTM